MPVTSATPKNGALWRDRRAGTADVDPRTLIPNPRNWRTHPDLQKDALAGVLAEVGLVQTVIVNTRTGRLVDGHLRVALALDLGQPTVPVTYVDLSEDEEATVLATLDPLSAMAGADTAALDALLRSVSVQDAAVQQMLADLAEGVGVVPGDDEWADALGDLPDGDKAPFQQMTFTVSDDQADTVKRALDAAKEVGAFIGTGNENSNGNALARIAEAYLGRR